MKTFICTLLACIVFTIAKAQNTNDIADSLRYGRRGMVQDTNIIGGIIGIYYKGATNYYAYGYTAKDKAKKTENTTLFEIGSNTKVFTALLLAEEMGKGRVDSKTYIDKYVPVNSGISNKVHLIDLVTHTSGLPTLHDSASMAEITQKDSLCPYCVVDDKYILSVVKKTDKLEDYGNFNYSNYGFALLGHILTQMNHSKYEQLINKNIFAPLHMNNSYVTMDTNDVRMATGYKDGERQPYIMLTGLAPAGIIKSDIRDMLSFVKYEMGVQHSTLDGAMQLSQQLHYKSPTVNVGLGWLNTVEYGDTIYVMRGDTYGFSSLMAFDRQQDLGVVILLNSESPNVTQHAFSYIMREIAGNDAKYASKFERPAIKLDSEILERYSGDYKISDNLVLSVSEEQNKLYIQLTGQGKYPAEAVSDNVFVERRAKAEFEFVKDKEGHYSKLILRQNGMEIPALKAN
jgi:CubicO group peptidase (beta-lactamase class C family)